VFTQPSPKFTLLKSGQRLRRLSQIISIKHLNTSDEQQHLSQLMGAEYRESQSCFEVIKNEGARRGHRK